MKRFVVILIAALLLVSLVGSMAACGNDEETTGSSDTQATQTTQADTGKAVVLRFTVPHPPGDPVTEAFQTEFVDKFNAQAGGRYVIEVHPSGALVSVPDSFEAVRTGAVEMGEWAIAVFGSIEPVYNLAELPFSVNSIEADAAYTQQMQKIYDQVATEKDNMHCVLAFTCQGLDVVSQKPVETLADWDKLLCQTISPPTAKVVELLGGAGVALDFSEAYQAMQKKVIEASPESGSMVIMFKMYEVAQYLTKCYLTPASIALWINLDTYNEMPADIKAMFDTCAAEAQTAINNTMIELYHTNYDQLTELGMTVYPLPAAERDKWAEKVQPFADQTLSEVDPAIADQVRQITQQLDEQYPYQD